jgi:hypothetical protein
MSKSKQPIASIEGRWLMDLAHTWTNIVFVQEVLAQLASVGAIVQQAVAQLPSIESICKTQNQREES